MRLHFLSMLFVLYLHGWQLYAAIPECLNEPYDRGRVSVATGITKPPYLFGEACFSGIEIDTIKETFALMGLKVRFTQMTNSRLGEVLLDDTSIEVSAGIPGEGKEGIFYSKPIVMFDNVIVSRAADDLKIDSFEALKGKRVTAWQDAHRIIGGTYYDLFNPEAAAKHSPSYREIASQQEQCRRFFQKETDLLIIDKNIFAWYKQRFAPATVLENDYRFHRLFLSGTRYRLGFRDAKLRDAFNTAFDRFKADGGPERIKTRYLSGNYQQKYHLLSKITSAIEAPFYDADTENVKKRLLAFLEHYPIRRLELYDTKTKNRFLTLGDTSEGGTWISKELIHTENGITVSTGILNILFDETAMAALDSTTLFEEHFPLNKEERAYLAKKARLRYCVDPDWLPFEKIERNRHIGVSASYIDIMRQNFGVEIELLPTESWTRTLEYAKTRQCDFIPLATTSEKRRKYLDFTDAYVSYPMVLVTSMQTPFIEDLRKLKRRKVGIVANYGFVDTIKKTYNNLEFVPVENLSQGMQMVERGELFGLIDTMPSVSYQIQHHFPASLKISAKLDERFGLGVATRNDEPLLHEIMQAFVASLDPQEKARIWEHWFTVRFDKRTDPRDLWKSGLIFLLILAIILYWNRRLSQTQARLVATGDDLEASLTHIQKLFNSTIAAVLVFEHNRCVDVNTQALRMFGYGQKEEMLGLRIRSFVKHMTYAASHEPDQQFELALMRRDGSYFPALVKYAFDAPMQQHIVSIIDITDLKQTEAKLYDLTQNLERRVEEEIEKNRQREVQLFQQSRQAQMGEMISMIAHQWRQPLSAIASTILALETKVNLNRFDFASEAGIRDLRAYLLERCNLIAGYVDTMSTTVDDFRTFYKKDKAKERVDIREIIARALSIISISLEQKGIKVTVNCPQAQFLNLYPNEIVQVILNIVQNSYDQIVDVSSENVSIAISVRPAADSILIELRDNAGGIPQPLIDKIFRPYFSTKESKNGTGLGLYMSKIIIEEHHNGRIDVRNCDSGACFTIMLPVN